mmetsp:Transcript_15135/g.54513  ORF Transcript_15135/g.54513 Transcript_15135/m.54513 type:complete len:452 (+) Transcript_15135:866-2221(+)
MTFDAPKPMIGPVNRTSSTSTKPELEIVSDVPECVIAAVDFVMIMLSPSVVTPDTPSVVDICALTRLKLPLTVTSLKIDAPFTVSAFETTAFANVAVVLTCKAPVMPTPEEESAMSDGAPLTPMLEPANCTVSTSTYAFVLEIFNAAPPPEPVCVTRVVGISSVRPFLIVVKPSTVSVVDNAALVSFVAPVTPRVPEISVSPVPAATVNLRAIAAPTSRLPVADKAPFTVALASVAAPDCNVPVTIALASVAAPEFSVPLTTVSPLPAATVNLRAPVAPTSKLPVDDSAPVTVVAPDASVPLITVLPVPPATVNLEAPTSKSLVDDSFPVTLARLTPPALDSAMIFAAPWTPMLPPENCTLCTATKPLLEIVSDVPVCEMAATPLFNATSSPNVATPETTSVLDKVADAKDAKALTPNVPDTVAPDAVSVILFAAPRPMIGPAKRMLSTST